MFPGHPGHPRHRHHQTPMFDQANLQSLHLQQQQQQHQMAMAAEMNMMSRMSGGLPVGLPPDFRSNGQPGGGHPHMAHRGHLGTHGINPMAHPSQMDHLALYQQQINHRPVRTPGSGSARPAPSAHHHAYYDRHSQMTSHNPIMDQRNAELARMQQLHQRPNHIAHKRPMSSHTPHPSMGQLGSFSGGGGALGHPQFRAAPIPHEPLPVKMTNSTSSLENNPFVSWNTPSTQHPPTSQPQPRTNQSRSQPSFPQPTYVPRHATPPLNESKIGLGTTPTTDEPSSEPVRVIAPSLLREREKKKREKEEKRKRLSAGSLTGSQATQSTSIIRPPVIQAPLNLTKPSSISSISISSNSHSIPPFELAPPANKSFTSNERNTSGLTGPIYKAEELLRQANSGPTSKQEVTSKNPEIIRKNESVSTIQQSVAETYPLLAQAISKCQKDIWIPDFSQNDDNDSLPGRSERKISRQSNTSTNDGSIEHPGLVSRIKFENNKRPGSPTGFETEEVDRKRSKSSNGEERKTSHDSHKSQIKVEHTDQATHLADGEFASDSDASSTASMLKAKRSVNRKPKIKREKIKEESQDHKIMKMINRMQLPANVKKLSCKVSAGETLLHAAARRGYLENIAYYLENGMGIDACDNAGFTPLHEAVTKGHYQCVKLLLEQGSNPNCQSSDGTRPVHDVAENGDFQILRLLLSFGADPTLTTYSGETPMELAVESCKDILQEYLDFISESNLEDAIKFPGDSRDIDIYEEESISSIPPNEKDIYDIEISDDPLPISYWLTIGDSADNFLLFNDIESKISNRSLQIISLPTEDFSKQVSKCGYLEIPSNLGEDDVRLVRLDAACRNVLGSKFWSSSTPP